METTPQFFRHGPGPLARLLFFALLSCLLMAEDLRFKYFPELRPTIAIIVFPIQKLAHLPAQIYDEIKVFLDSFHVLKENEILRQRYLKDREQLLRLRTLQTENKQLRKLLGAVKQIESETKAKAVLAEILYTPRDPFSHKTTLNKGSQHQIQAGQIVIDNKGIIGQITQVYPWVSEVTLITDKDHSVPIQVVRNNLRSVISGAGKNNELELRYLSVNTDIQTNDLLVTSGIGGVYPPGIPVATVTEIDRNPADTFAKITSTPIGGVDRNRQVLILSLLPPMPNNPAETSEIDAENY